MAFLGWGLGDIFFAFSTRRVGSVKTLFWQLLLATIISSFYIPFIWPVADYRMLFYSSILGLFYFFGSLTFFKALEIGNISLVGTIAGSFPVLVVVLSYFVYSERLGGIQTLGILLILIGLFLVSIKKVGLGSSDTKIPSLRGLKYAFLTMMLWGIYFTFIKIPSLSIGWFWPTYTFNLMFIFLLVYSLVTKKSLSLKRDIKSSVYILAAMLLTTLALFAYNLGVSLGYVSLVAPIAGSYPVLFVLMSRFVFKEPLTSLQAVGLLSTLLGIVIISVSSHLSYALPTGMFP